MEITRTETTVTTRVVVSATEVVGLAHSAAGWQAVVQKALAAPGAVGQADVVVEAEPTPYQRLPPGEGRPMANCPKCGNRITLSQLNRHMRSATCRRNRARFNKLRGGQHA